MKSQTTMLDHVRAVQAGTKKLSEVPAGARSHVARLIALPPEVFGRPAGEPSRPSVIAPQRESAIRQARSA